MSQQYSYRQAPAAPHRLPANPDEDWTQISDLAARRRIQNRIAQRNYRRKLKRRLDDLERRAGYSSASPPQSHTELKPSKPTATNMHKTSSSSRRTTKLSPRATHQNPHQYTPPLTQSDGLFLLDRATFHTPPLFTYVPYPAPDESAFYEPYGRTPYTTSATTATIPSVHNYSAPTQRQFYDPKRSADDEDLNSFGMSYAAMAGLDI